MHWRRQQVSAKFGADRRLTDVRMRRFKCVRRCALDRVMPVPPAGLKIRPPWPLLVMLFCALRQQRGIVYVRRKINFLRHATSVTLIGPPAKADKATLHAATAVSR